MSNLAQQERFDHAKSIIRNRLIPRIYELIFSTPEFPVWFVFQVYFGVVLSAKLFENGKSRIRSLLTTLLVTFVPTILIDVFVGKDLPLKESYKSVILCVCLWAVNRLFPSELLYTILNKSSVVFGPLHIFGMMRCLRYYNYLTRNNDWLASYLCGVVISISDILCAKLMFGKKSIFTSISAFMRIILMYTLFFFLTEESPAMIVFGVLPYAPVGLVLSILFASMEFAVHALDVFDTIGFVEPKIKQD